MRTRRARAALTLLAAVVLPVNAGGQQLSVNPPHDTVEVRGWLDDAGPWTGYVRLTAAGKDVPQLAMFPSELSCTIGGEFIQRQHVTLGETTVALAAGVPTDVPVRVAGTHVPGECRGTLRFQIARNATGKPLEVPIVVQGRPRQTLTGLPGTEPLRMDLVRCWGPGCWLASLLLPRGAQANGRVLSFDNPGRISPRAIALYPLLTGQHSGTQIDSAICLATDPCATTAGAKPGSVADTTSADRTSGSRILRIPLTVDRGLLASDKYTGSLRLALEGRQDPVVVPAEVNVRMGPVWPLIALVVGLLLGRLMKFVQARETQLRLLSRLDALDTRAHAELDAQDQPAVLVPAARMRNAVRLSHVLRNRLEEVEAQITRLDTRIDLLVSMNDATAELTGLGDPRTKGALGRLAAARTALRTTGDDDGAKQALDEAIKTLRDILTSPPPGGGVAYDPGDSDATIASWTVRSDQLGTALEVTRLELARRFGRPLLYLLLLVMLSLVGLRTFYVDAGATFGATPLTDFLTLIIWGLSADATSRTLSDLARTPSVS